ncbi:MAG: hypothetical protein U0V70_02085 [Terriglobia bacterium]
MRDLLLNAAVLLGILGGAAVFTQWFSRRMYNQCARCHALNAKRRKQCRVCGMEL